MEMIRDRRPGLAGGLGLLQDPIQAIDEFGSMPVAQNNFGR